MSIKQLILAIIMNVVALPGGGQWYLKERKRALYFMGPTLLILGLLLQFMQTKISAQREDLSQYKNLSPLEMADSFSKDVWNENRGEIKIHLFFLIGCYVASVADVVWLFQKNKK